MAFSTRHNAGDIVGKGIARSIRVIPDYFYNTLNADLVAMFIQGWCDIWCCIWHYILPSFPGTPPGGRVFGQPSHSYGVEVIGATPPVQVATGVQLSQAGLGCGCSVYVYVDWGSFVMMY